MAASCWLFLNLYYDAWIHEHQVHGTHSFTYVHIATQCCKVTETHVYSAN